MLASGVAVRHKWANLLMFQAYMAAACGLAACPTPRQPEKAQRRVDFAKGLLKEGNLPAAEKELREAQAMDPRNDEAWFVHGHIYVVRAATNVSLAEYENCVTGEQATELRKQTDDYLRIAEEKLAHATKLSPDYGDAWMNRGVVAILGADWDKAIEHETKALENLSRLSSEANARGNLGWALYKKGEHLKAGTELLQALQRDPGYCLGSYRLAEVFFKQVKFDEAYERVKVFAGGGICEKYPILEAFYLGGQISLRLGDEAAARQWFDACVERAPKACVAEKCETAAGKLP